MPVMGVVGDGGGFRPCPPTDRPWIRTKYYPDDGYHAVLVETGDFDPLYRAGSYLILVTETVRDAVVSRPALFTLIGGGGRFGMVEWVTREEVCLRPARPGRDAAVVPRDRIEMVYVPVEVRMQYGSTTTGVQIASDFFPLHRRQSSYTFFS